MQALELLKKEGKSKATHGVPIAVAFNPYLPAENDFKNEKQRLRRKLQTGMVDSVYLQNGNDLERLQEGLQCIQQARGDQDDLKILGSVFLPSKRYVTILKTARSHMLGVA